MQKGFFRCRETWSNFSENFDSVRLANYYHATNEEVSWMKKSLFVHEINAEEARRFSLRGAVSSPIKVFHLADAGIDSERFLMRLGQTFHSLPSDPYDPALAAERLVSVRLPDVYRSLEAQWLELWNDLADLQYANPLAGPQFWELHAKPDDIQNALRALRPHRRRSCFQYLARLESFSACRWQLHEIGVPTFAQAVTDVRARPRRFASCPIEVYRDPDILHLIAFVCQLVCQTASVIATVFRVTLHQMLTYADNAAGREPAPEGTHQDGSPFIVSALVIERQNVIGGVSRIYYAKDSGLALQHELQPGYGILQSDTHNEYWHGVTAIYPLDPTKKAYRSILGLDIDFVENGLH